MAGPLDGLRVVDWTTGTAGPRAAGLLADYGADVIRIEPPTGDRYAEALAVEYSVFNRGKRIVRLDLREEAGRATVESLLDGADVFVTSWSAGVPERFGLGSAQIVGRHPRLVACTISGFGPDDRYAGVAGHESLVHALVGTMGEQVGVREGPIYEGLPFAGIGAAYLAVVGTLGALHRRDEDGLGRTVETSLFDGALSYLSMLWAVDEVSKGWQGAGTRRLLSQALECGDGEYLGVHTGAVGAFGRLMEVLGLSEHFPPVPPPEPAHPLSPEQARILAEDVPAIFKTRPRAAWLEALETADVCAIPELRPGEVFDSPQAIHNRMVLRIDDPMLGSVEQVAPPARFALTPHADPVPAAVVDVPAWRSAEAWSVPNPDPQPDRPLLAGVKVLDFGAFYAGPYGSRLLADLGADVVKLEPPVGDQLRGLDRPFGSAQANKRAIALNTKDPDARAAALRLAAWADVVQHNLRPGAAERMGLGYEDVKAVNPEVVYAYSPGWGSSGPSIQRQSFAPLVSGYVGVNFEVAGLFNEPLFPVGNEDPGNGLVGAVGMLMGLLHRRRSGKGQYLEHPQLNATMTHVAHIVRQADGTVLGAGKLDTLEFGIGALDRLYETADGWICLSVGEDRLDGLQKVLGIDLLGDPRYATTADRAENDFALAGDLADAIALRPTEALLTELRNAGVPAAVPVPKNDAAFLKDEHNHQTGRVGVSAHPTRGTVRELARLVRVEGAAPVAHRHAPLLGEHTDELLAAVGTPADTIAGLRERGAAR
ncbi:CoA transferase [Pseudonocardia sp. NPDC049154]|uniref:CaiB/BaiF CoA transferase family protein n=1 Tax=Pseudonocardia sp. NPDC049154 TaxID=3155501 RepID=UPI0033C95989